MKREDDPHHAMQASEPTSLRIILMILATIVLVAVAAA